MTWSVLPRTEKVLWREESQLLVLGQNEEDVRKTTEPTGNTEHKEMLGLEEEVFICLWHRQEKTGTAHALSCHGACDMCCCPSGPSDHTHAFDYILFSKRHHSFHLITQILIKGFFKSRNLTFIGKSRHAVKSSQSYRNINVIKSTRFWELFTSTHTHKKAKPFPPEKGSLSL